MRAYLRLPTSRSRTWSSRIGVFLAGALALAVTAAIVVAAFFVGVVLLGLLALSVVVFWIRHRIRGRRAPRTPPGTSRRPVVIDGEFVVLSTHTRSRNS